jgi:hypothetical protein
MRWTNKEIREQLADLGDYRAEVQAERDELAETYDRMLDVGKELDARLDRISRSTAEWSARAGAKGIPEGEILELLGLPRPTDLRPHP